MGITVNVAIFASIALLVAIYFIYSRVRHVERSYGTVVITGASSGLGHSFALQYARRAQYLVLIARSRQRLADVATECRALSPSLTVDIISADLSSIPSDTAGDVDHQGAEATANAIKALGISSIDCLVLNAGISSHCPAAVTPLSHLERVMDVNFTASVVLTQRLMPLLSTATRPRIAVVSSIQGFAPTPTRAVYSASKHALHGFFGALATENAWLNVTVVCPGWLDTNLRASSLSRPGAKVSANSKHALSPDVAAAVAVQAIADGKRMIIIPRRFWLVYWAQVLVPGLLARIMRRSYCKKP
ncbi:Glucose/ribitol dehydrogenase [Carpediemonas membranifera]|uniref:Glucose/ribitol dehydrogenase n=1 Tax=Carpediemonas membranifera TaxID=201153 RepID=A0A8J6DY93_9EUKA|nr:Glucose/ribitol dehydrogenase [Carpediemonas membranifera]|eukprot:KAG9391794.1 Glucose/ribitol dehydrogenase [Carpediemonas membranifera]